MSDSAFDYDVFLSFASGDEPTVRPIWQHLTMSGLRVFWSDVSLRERVGTSWFDVIQEAVSRSRHLVVVCTPAALESKWVKREYVAFFNHHFSAPTRRLIPIITSGVTMSALPLFLRELEAVQIGAPGALATLARSVGGVDLEGLQRELVQRDAEVAVLRNELALLRARLSTAETPVQRTPSSASLESEIVSPPEPPLAEPKLVQERRSRSAKEGFMEKLLGPRDAAFDRFIAHTASAMGLPVRTVEIGLPLIVLVIFVVLWLGSK